MRKERIINFRPAFFVAIGCILGIADAFYWATGTIATAIVIAVCSLMLIAAVFFLVGAKDIVKKFIVYTGLFLIAFIFCGLNFFCIYTDYENSDLNGGTFIAVCRVDEIKNYDGGQRLVVSDLKLKGNREIVSDYKALLSVFGDSDYDLGDRLTFKGTFYDRGAFYNDNYSASYVADKIKYTVLLNADDVTLLSSKPTLFEKSNMFLRDGLKEGLDEDEFSVAYALICGNSLFMDDDLLTNFRDTGIAHIFAVSGLHIGFLSAVLNFVFDKLKTRRIIKFLAIPPTLFFYSGICGFTASSIRAAIMATVMLFATITGRKYDGLSSVSIAAIIVLAIFPAQLFCVGFQLSFGIVLGIIVLARRISKLLKFLPHKLADSLGVVLSAQLVSIPIMLQTFGSFSCISVLINLLFVPIVGVIYVFILVATLIGSVLGIARITVFIPNYVLKVIIAAVNSFDFSIFKIGGFAFGVFMIAYFWAMYVLSDKVNAIKLIKISLSSILLSVTVVGAILCEYVSSQTPKYCVIGSDTINAVCFYEKDETTLVVSYADDNFRTNRLETAMRSLNINKINNVVILNNSEGTDVQRFISKIYPLTSFDTVYCFADDETANMLMLTFRNKKFVFVSGGDFLTETGKYNIWLSSDGYMAKVGYEGKEIAVFGKLEDNTRPIKELPDDYDGVIIAWDYLSVMKTLYKKSEIISFTRNVNYKDAERCGNLLSYLR